MTVAPEQLKACCAGAYSGELARWLLGDSFHPGGAELTARLARSLHVGPGDLVVDVGCGPGTSALQLARVSGCEVVGVDLAPPTDPPCDRRVRYVRGDAEALPLDDASVDGVLCECSLCLFPDKTVAVGEFVRVLRTGGRLALSDVTADPTRLPAELASPAGWVACLADAQPTAEIADLLVSAGLELEAIEQHDRALAELVERVRARLRLAHFLLGDAAGRGLALADAARAAIAAGALGYGVWIARKP